MDGNSRILEGLAHLAEAGQDLGAIGDYDLLLDRVAEMALQTGGARTAAVYVAEPSRASLELRSIAGTAVSAARSAHALGNGLIGWVGANRQAMIINGFTTDPRHNPAQEDPLLEGARNILAVPLVWENSLIGVLAVVDLTDGRPFDDEDLELLQVLGQQTSQAIHHARVVEKLHNFMIHSIELMVMAVERVTPLREGHAVRVARLATALARRVGLTDDEYQDLYYAALLHDLGKLRTFNGEQAESHHPILGAEMIRPIKMLERAAALIESSHENYSGTGFPRAISNSELSRSARILALAEAYTSWCDEREEAGFSPDPGRFLKEREGAIDPALIDPFLSLAREEP